MTDSKLKEDVLKAIDWNGSRSDSDWTKTEIKEQFILDALRDLVSEDRRTMRAMLVDAKIHRRLHDEGVFEKNIDSDCIPDLWDIKSYLHNNCDVGFATITDHEESGTWVIEKSDSVDDRNVE